MTNHMILADFKTSLTSTGWANNAYIVIDWLDNMNDEALVKGIENQMREEYKDAELVVFMEIFGELVTVDKLNKIQNSTPEIYEEFLKGRVSRLVINNEDLYKEWLKPEGRAAQ